VTTTNPIHSVVKEHYARLADQKPATSCCGGSTACDCATDGIDENGILSLGCGTPIQQANLQAGETVLDLGSGAGPDCAAAARLVGPTGHVIGLDMTPEMIAKATANMARLGLSTVEFRQGLLESMPLDDASVNVVISNCVINLSPDKPAVFAEVFRVLKPGGRLVFSDVVVKGELPHYLAEDMEAWSACVSGALDADLYVDLLNAAGFSKVTLQVNDTFGSLTEVPQNQPFSALISAYKAN
jgi:ubiquinone/menaquinone biosynthesis C-methylase UbiE